MINLYNLLSKTSFNTVFVNRNYVGSIVKGTLVNSERKLSCWFLKLIC